jgi:hypothetical protein
MRKLLRLKPWLALVIGPPTACSVETSVTTGGDFDPAPSTIGSTVSATTTSPLLETTTPGAPEETPSSSPPSVSFVDMAGTYEARDSGDERLLQIMDDGRLQWAPNRTSPQTVLTAKFEGASVLITDPDCGEDVAGVYEFNLLETGDLAVVLIEDDCPGRAANIPGDYTRSD